MVELCELKLMDQGLECQWPPDIDQHIAELDFERSTDDEANSLFSSMALDPSIISTDSLDMEKFHARCEVNKNDYKLTFEESDQWASGDFTTWGRIRSTEPLDEKTNSLPELNGTPKAAVEHRPSSLLATFVERQPDYEYSELYMGNGRYVDVNDNEIGFVPQSTAALQSADRWRVANRLPPNPPLKPRRTFADFQSRAPQLDFMAMEHQMPSLCQSSVSLSEIMVKVKEGTIEEEKLDLSVLNVFDKHGPDSGLGSSASATSGPSHIEDWPSLAILLPKHVVEACSFFKMNTRLLGGSNNIEKNSPRRSEACRTCFGVRRRLHPPIWAQPASARHVLCDCTSSEIFERDCYLIRDRSVICNRLKLHAQELSIVGLPIYDSKRMLVERVVEGVAEVARGSNTKSLCSAMETLIADGLNNFHPWQMIVKLTAPGPATSNVYSLVRELDGSEKSLNSRVSVFLDELLRLGSMDCWMCYVVLKENVLRALYVDGAFMLRACTAYRSLLWRLIENLELLTLIEKRAGAHSEREQRRPVQLEAARLPSDSRVPKSSSVPARLSSSPKPSNSSSRTHSLRRTRIPKLSARPARAASNGASWAADSPRGFASAVDDLDEPGLLSVSRGERLRVLTTRGALARCCRVRPRHDRVFQGLIPTSNLIMN